MKEHMWAHNSMVE